MRFARLTKIAAVAACLCIAVALASPAADAAAKTLVVEAGKTARAGVPMSVALPQGTLHAKMTDGAKEVPCQVAEGNLCWILDQLPAGAAKTYAVDLGATSAAEPEAVRLDASAETVEVSIDGKPFTTYHIDNPSIAGVQIKRPYFWPVFGPDQTSMMRAWPCADDPADKAKKDHPHHTGLWVAYGEVGGVDNWSNTPKAGWQVHKAFDKRQSGPVVGYFRETLDWTDAAKKPNMAEVRTARFWRLPASGRMIDLEVVFQAKYGKVVFGDTKEGGLCSTRMRSELRGDKEGAEGRLVLSTGAAGETAVWGKRADWCDASGMVGGKRYGYAIFDTPGNLTFPTRWHARGYGLVSTNPFAVAAFEKGAPKNEVTLDEGKEMTFRYRLYFHPGDEKAAGVAARYADYADPPKVTWK